MKRRTLLQFAALVGCSRALPAGSEPASTAWLRVGQEFAEVGAHEVVWARGELERIGGLVRERLRVPENVARAARDVVFEQCGFVREVDDSSLRFVLLPSVLRERRGSCVGLGTLLIALIQLAGGDARGVVRPGHFHVRVHRPGGERNLEPLRAGEEMPDDWYENRFPVSGRAGYYARSLSSNEVLGVIEYNIGRERQRHQRWNDARRAFSRAVSHFPAFAEAHASLGTVLHVEGELEAAERAYRSALRNSPQLPGLEWNLELLLTERARAGMAQSAPARPSGR